MVKMIETARAALADLAGGISVVYGQGVMARVGLVVHGMESQERPLIQAERPVAS